MTQASRRVINGCKLPTEGPVSETERAWVEILRIYFNDAVPMPGLPYLQSLRIEAKGEETL